MKGFHTYQTVRSKHFDPSSLIKEQSLQLLRCRLKKNVQLESCELSFIWVKMRTAAREAVPQIPERLLQSGSRGKSIYKVSVKGEFNAMKHPFYKRFFVSHEDLMSS